MNAAWTVLRKEIVDALRDRKTLLSILLSSIAMGPLVIVLISVLVSQFEERAEKREVVAQGMQYAPQLRNWFERQTFTVREAPADFEQRLRDGKLNEPVVVVPEDFQAQLARGEAPTVEIVSDSANRNADAGVGRVKRLIAGYVQEQGVIALALRGVPPSLTQPIDVQERDIASAQSRGAQVLLFLPFYAAIVVLLGTLNVAQDTMVGERERGSLEPLLMTPASRMALVLGKWGAAAAVGMLIAVLWVVSIVASRGLITSEAMEAAFRFGAGEGLRVVALLVPFAGAMAALMMAVAIRCKTVKEAQAQNSIVMMAINLTMLVPLIGQSGEQRWWLWVPGLAQQTVMNRVLKGDAIDAAHVLLPAAVCVLLAAACLAFIARELKTAAVR
jgi:sodium transport system permease protein